MQNINNIEINIPIPLLNTLYRTNKHNVIYKSKKAKLFNDYILNNFKRDILIDKNIEMEIHFYIKRDSDIDGRLKLLLDSFNKVVYTDDILIQKIIVQKHLIKDNKDIKTTVKITEII